MLSVKSTILEVGSTAARPPHGLYGERGPQKMAVPEGTPELRERREMLKSKGTILEVGSTAARPPHGLYGERGPQKMAVPEGTPELRERRESHF